MKPFSLLFPRSIALGLAVTLLSCNSNADPEAANPTEERPRVVASYSLLCEFTEEIAQDTVEIDCLVGGGEDPHAYNPTPQDRRAIEQADLVLYGGYDHEPIIVSLIEANERDIPKIAVHEVAVRDPIIGEAHDDHGDEDEHGHGDEDEHGAEAPDPHVWHDVENAIAMVEIIEAELSSVNPEAAATYSENAENLKGQLGQLHAWIQEQVETIPPDQRKIILTHDALSYYAQAYQIEQTGALQGLFREERPTAASVTSLARTIQESGVPTIFVEANISDQVIQTVAREANVEVASDPLYIDGLGSATDEAGTYIGMMTSNTCTIVNGLGGTCEQFSPN